MFFLSLHTIMVCIDAIYYLFLKESPHLPGYFVQLSFCRATSLINAFIIYMSPTPPKLDIFWQNFIEHFRQKDFPDLAVLPNPGNPASLYF